MEIIVSMLWVLWLCRTGAVDRELPADDVYFSTTLLVWQLLLLVAGLLVVAFMVVSNSAII
jgi:hypothetical protein